VLKKLIHKKSLIFLLIFIIILLFINTIISNIIKRKISELLLKEKSKYYVVQVDGVQFNLLKRSIVLNNIFMSPTSNSFSNLKNKKTDKNALEKIHMSSVELNGIHLLKILFYNRIEINTLKINNLLFQKFKNDNIKKKPREKLNIDSIYIKNLNGLKINKISVSNLIYQVTDVSSNKISFQNQSVSFNLTGFELEEYENDYFKLKPVNNEFEIDKINIDFPDKKYNFSIDAISVDFEKDNIFIKNLTYKPLIKKVALANEYKFNTEVFDLSIKKINLYNFGIGKILKNEGLFIDSVSVSNLDLKLYKDKRKPFDLNKRPVLPHIALKQMKTPLLIHKINILNSNLFYEEKLEKKELSLIVILNDINSQISNISSIKKYRENPLKINIKTKFMNSSDMNVDINLPLKNGRNKFYFNGSLGPSKFKYFDKVIIPAVGMKILQGDLDGLTFSASADDFSSSGKMTMLYHDLEAEVFKSKSTENNKLLSWTVNHVVHNSNPGKNGKIREARMHFERTIYKGIVNYIWKTLQSGLTNTIAPIGKTTNQSKKKEKNKEEKIKKKDERKKMKNNN
jgi:hypothetical protein